MKRIEHIVVGTDFSPIADRAVDAALDLARSVGASVTLVHAYELPTYAFPDGVIVSTANMAGTISTAGRQGLDATLERFHDRGVTLRSALRLGGAAEELCSVADEEKADLIVVGTHGRRGLARALLGSVAERLVRTAHHPVMVVPSAYAPGRDDT